MPSLLSPLSENQTLLRINPPQKHLKKKSAHKGFDSSLVRSVLMPLSASLVSDFGSPVPLPSQNKSLAALMPYTL
jgi:hypothetical protein